MKKLEKIEKKWVKEIQGAANKAINIGSEILMSDKLRKKDVGRLKDQAVILFEKTKMLEMDMDLE